MQVVLLSDFRMHLEEIIAILLENHFRVFGICFGESQRLKHQEVFYAGMAFRVLSRQELLECRGIDAMLSYGYRYYIPRTVFSAVKYCINFHPGLLPKYKGCYTLYYGMMNGEKAWGMTAHFVNETFDDGEIIYTETFTLDYEKTGREISQYLWEKVGVSAFAKVICMLKENLIPTRHANSSAGEGDYYSLEDLDLQKRLFVRDLEDLGYEEIVRRVRAMWFPPYDGLCVQFQEGQELLLIDRKTWDIIKDKI